MPRDSDALVDGECLPLVRGGVAVLQVAVADTFEGASFLLGDAQVAGHGKGPGVVIRPEGA